MTAAECEARLGPRGNQTISSANRGFVQKWLTAHGVPASRAKDLPLKLLQQAYNELGDFYLDELRAGAPVRPVTQHQTPRPTPAPTITQEPAPMQNGQHHPQAENAAKLADALAAMLTSSSAPLDRGAVEMIVTETLDNDTIMANVLNSHGPTIRALVGSTVTRVEIKTGDQIKPIEGACHRQLPLILKAIQCGNVYLRGPAGSGKTTVAHQVADALSLPFFFTGAIASEYKLTGFIDAQGRYVSTAFRKAYEHGGVFLFDEIDASLPGAVLAFNAALANGHADFPDSIITKHPDFRCIAAANTYGQGADRVYVGRNQLDGATLDRFAFIDFDYDEALERQLAGNDDWTKRVQAVRKAVATLKLRHVVSPRASIMGAKLLAQGVERPDVETLTIWKGLDAETIAKINSNAR